MQKAKWNSDFTPFSRKKKEKKHIFRTMQTIRHYCENDLKAAGEVQFCCLIVRVNVDPNLFVLPDRLLCLESADMYVANLCRELGV